MSKPLEKQFVFVIGAPRSGTTWLHRMLSDHPSVASLKDELTLFSSYLAPVAERYLFEKDKLDRGSWSQGLPLLFTPQEFDQALSMIVSEVYGRVLRLNPEATHIMDKHPAYGRCIPLIDRLLPNSRFIHIIRDGRDVAISMIKTKKEVGFGAGDIKSAAQAWVQDVTTARADGTQLGPERYMEVRYEELIAGTEQGLQQLFRFAGLEVLPGQRARIADDHRIENRQVSWGDPGLNALRKVPGAIWRTKLNLEDRYLMDRYAGLLLQDLSFAAPGWWMLTSTDRMRMSLLQFKQRLGLIAYRLRHL